MTKVPQSPLLCYWRGMAIQAGFDGIVVHLFGSAIWFLNPFLRSLFS
jgi:hypothetical protein